MLNYVISHEGVRGDWRTATHLFGLTQCRFILIQIVTFTFSRYASTIYFNSCTGMQEDRNLTSNFCIEMPKDDISTGETCSPHVKATVLNYNKPV